MNFYGGIVGLLCLCTIVIGFGSGCEMEEKIYHGNYRITTQSRLDALSGYTRITGNLSIGRDDYDLGGTTLTNLDGLESLTSIGGDLKIGYVKPIYEFDRIYPSNLYKVENTNPLLENIDGLCNLRSVGGRLIIRSCDSLK